MEINKRKLGRTSFTLNPIGLGAMPLSIQGHPPEEQGIQVLKTAVSHGVDFIDTANAYCLDENDTGRNEKLIRRALDLEHSKHSVVVATKGGCTRFHGSWGVDCRPESLRAAAEKSLLDLGVSKIDLYYLHAVDPKVPIEKSVEELAKLKQEGKIASIGISNVSPDELRRALKITRIEAVQNRFNPVQKQDLRNGMVDLCRELDIAFVAHSPVGGHHGHRELSQNSELKKMAEKYHQSVYAICLRWILDLGQHTFAIPGASKESSILDSLKANDFQLDPKDRQKISESAFH